VMQRSLVTLKRQASQTYGSGAQWEGVETEGGGETGTVGVDDSSKTGLCFSLCSYCEDGFMHCTTSGTPGSLLPDTALSSPLSHRSEYHSPRRLFPSHLLTLHNEWEELAACMFRYGSGSFHDFWVCVTFRPKHDFACVNPKYWGQEVRDNLLCGRVKTELSARRT
jgi:hypothetical protein